MEVLFLGLLDSTNGSRNRHKDDDLRGPLRAGNRQVRLSDPMPAPGEIAGRSVALLVALKVALKIALQSCATKLRYELRSKTAYELVNTDSPLRENQEKRTGIARCVRYRDRWPLKTLRTRFAQKKPWRGGINLE